MRPTNPLRGDLERRGYTVDETMRAMGMSLTDILMPRPELERGSEDWDDYQSTEMAERVYATVGFRDLGLILEYVP